MKKLVYVALILVLLASLSSVFIQADDEMIEKSGAFTQHTDSGTFVDNGDDTFTLTLNGIGENSAWLISAPNKTAGLTPNIMYADLWNAVPDGMEASAVITTEEYLLLLTVSSPAFDMDTDAMSYVAVIDEIIYRGSEELKGDPEVPESFDEAAMFVLMDNAFLENWAAGAEAQLAGARPTGGTECDSTNPSCN